ncbi:unnamed protein product [Oikopleura dioica]|uniref:C-type lectin domain-containing protein n=1 Tax=Oikopleura dioica TaxID=34765 RepID=E4X860_OIKDI|nr:unnamed protein product [Oikopleura dioica]
MKKICIFVSVWKVFTLNFGLSDAKNRRDSCDGFDICVEAYDGIKYYAMIPNANEYLNFYEAENFCKDKNKTLSTISSESEQIELSKMAHELSQQNQEGARLWLGLVRKDTKDEFSWRYHVIDENNKKVDVTCDVTEPIFWERDPDAYTEGARSFAFPNI